MESLKRHAYCIIAHNDDYCLQKLVNCIDDARNDIFLLLDRKVDRNKFSIPQPNKSQLFVVPKENSVDIRWADLSQVKAELIVLEAACQQAKYDYIHLISGQDLPLKDQDYIHDFFNRLPSGSNLINFMDDELCFKEVEHRTRYYHVFTSLYRHKLKIVKYSCSLIRLMALGIQKVFGFRRKWTIKLKKGSNWISITQDFCEYLVSQSNNILDLYKNVKMPDELFVQTLVYNSSFRDTTLANHTRKIDWERGRPYTWRECDYDELISSDALFARKFSSVTDKRIIDKISSYVLNK